jgi:hypothetical protein
VNVKRPEQRQGRLAEQQINDLGHAQNLFVHRPHNLRRIQAPVLTARARFAEAGRHFIGDFENNGRN